MTLATYPSDEALRAQSERLKAAHAEMWEYFTFSQTPRPAPMAVEDDAPAALARIESDLRLGRLLARAACRAALAARQLLGITEHDDATEADTTELRPTITGKTRGR